MDKLLSTVNSPRDLQGLSLKDLTQLTAEMREVLCQLAGTRTAHFASNLGVVELTLALHTSFDFSHDRLIWDTGHQVYPHKMLTGRYDGDRLDEYGLPATVLHLAGHSHGSVAVLTDDRLLFCGDVLENRRRPRPATLVDDPADLRTAVARLRGLETGRVYPGHGAPFHMDELREGG